ncbi:hypothetical protein PO124_29915 [Bacillus licheniformis]|nr:hypothetical protein [Bacillus licheniformis]
MENKIISPRNGNLLKGLSGDAYEINAEFQVNTGAAAEFGFKSEQGNEYTKSATAKQRFTVRRPEPIRKRLL